MWGAQWVWDFNSQRMFQRKLRSKEQGFDSELIDLIQFPIIFYRVLNMEALQLPPNSTVYYLYIWYWLQWQWKLFFSLQTLSLNQQRWEWWPKTKLNQPNLIEMLQSSFICCVWSEQWKWSKIPWNELTSFAKSTMGPNSKLLHSPPEMPNRNIYPITGLTVWDTMGMWERNQ